MLKRCLGILMACCMLFTLVQPMALATETAPAFVVSNETVNMGAEDAVVDVTVTMKNNPGIDRVAFKVDFPSELELAKKPVASEILPAMNFRSNLSSPYPINMGDNASEEIVAPAGTDGVILTLTFNVKAGTPAGTYDVKLIEQTVRDHDMGTVAFETVNGGVTVKTDPTERNITYPTPENGNSVSGPTTAKAGDPVTLTVTYDETKYDLTALTYNGTDILSAKSFTMPDEDVTIAATFTAKGAPDRNITYPAAENGNSVSGPTTAKAGDPVTLTVTYDETKYDLTALTYNGTDILSAKSFTMPDEDVTIAATFTAKNPGDNTGDNTSGGGGCYIATSVYGSYDCPQVWTLRRFRDDVLGQTWYGRLFIKAYYATSPTLVKWFGDAEWFQSFWRDKLDSMVENLQDDGFESTPYQDQDW